MKVRALVLVAIVGALIWLASPMLSGPGSNGPVANLPVSLPPDKPLVDREESTSPKRTASDEETAEQSRCFSEFELESHPMFADEEARLEATNLTGPTIEGYRELDEAALQDLATQKDSAAMAVLGARHLLEALGDDPDLAVSLLKNEKNRSWRSIPRPLPDSVSESFTQAKHWFYRSALHGRVDALQYFGWTIELFEGGAVQLGWVDRDTFDSMGSREKTALMPSNIYNIARLNIIPELGDGLMGEVMLSLIPSTERSVQVVNQISETFLLDLQAAGLPRPSIKPTALPDLEDMLSMLCEKDRQRLEADFGE